jgi:hypothetical protein
LTQYNASQSSCSSCKFCSPHRGSAPPDYTLNRLRSKSGNTFHGPGNTSFYQVHIHSHRYKPATSTPHAPSATEKHQSRARLGDMFPSMRPLWTISIGAERVKGQAALTSLTRKLLRWLLSTFARVSGGHQPRSHNIAFTI